MPDTPEKFGHLLSKKTSVEWKLENFIDRTGGYAKSPTFQLFDANFYIEMKIVRDFRKTLLTDNNITVFVYLCKESSPSEFRIEYSIRLKKSIEGSVFKYLYFNHLFPSEAHSYGRVFKISQNLKAENLSAWNGTLIVFCEARVAHYYTTAEAETQTESVPISSLDLPPSLKTLSKNFEDIYVNGWGTDAVIEVKGKKFSAHRLILSTRSSVFRSMFNLNKKVKKTGFVKITDCDPESFGAFLQFLYSGKLDIHTSENALDLYITAEKYKVEDLREACIEYMNREGCFVVHLAELCDGQKLLNSSTINFIKNACEIPKSSKWEKKFQNLRKRISTFK